MYTTIIVMCTIFTVVQILRLYGVFEINTKPRKVVSNIEDERKVRKKRRREQKLLNTYSSFANMFRGILLTPLTVENNQFYIDRLDIRTKYLGRRYTVEEFRGKHALPFGLSLVLIPLIVKIPFILIVPIVAFIYLVGYQTLLKQEIQDEDEIIDNYFIDIYLLLFSKLRQGSRARLQTTLENYINTLEGQALTKENEVMLKFARYFLNLLAMYEDHQAVPKLRDIYHSATIINFCNIASQSLQGVDNFDNLMTFKLQLVDRKTVIMRKRQQQILASGERSIYAIWVILFIFVVVGWYSKLPTGFF